MKLTRFTPLVAALWLASIPSPALAGCVACSCSTSATNLNFGTYNAASPSPALATANITVNCFSLLVLMVGTVDVALSAGASGTATQRTLVNGTSRLNYNVYQDGARTAILGGLGVGGAVRTLSINGLLTYATTLTAYGSIPERQWVKAGTYSDTVVVTIIY